MKENEQLIKAFEEHTGYKLELEDVGSWLSFQSFVAGTKYALEIAAEKAEIGMKKKSHHGKYRKWQKVKEDEVDLFSYEVQYFVNKESILNCLK